ncbi:MAG: hypothetical protein M3319_07465 [Actinomycetota bacterium]|nr:hypothetical protein [Actinomycetota bacterium]
MKKIIIGAMVAAGIILGTVQPAIAATSAPSSQCTQAQASILKLKSLAASSPEPYKTAYNNMALGAQTAANYYCH